MTMAKPRIAMLRSLMRMEEKMLLKAFADRGVPLDVIDDRKVVFDLHKNGWSDYQAVVERCINHARALYALRILNDWNIPKAS